MEKTIKYNLKEMSDESILTLGNILSGSKLKNSTDTKIIYSNEVYFALGRQYVNLEFVLKKQEDGSWLITNL